LAGDVVAGEADIPLGGVVAGGAPFAGAGTDEDCVTGFMLPVQAVERLTRKSAAFLTEDDHMRFSWLNSDSKRAIRST